MLLKGESTEDTFVEGITYNARGQRESIDYGNGVGSTYSYEPTTFRMTGLVTTRDSDSKVLQDISYVYDPVGNIVKLTDGSHDCVFTNNQAVNAACGYTYDAMYRLTAAAGREHIALAQDADTDAAAFLRSAWAHLNNATQLVNYTENYVYDSAGNLTQMQHAGTSTYTRYIDIDTDTNRGLLRPAQGSPDFANSFDGNGNQILMGHVNSIAWDFMDRLQKVVLIPRDNDQDDAEWYVYDGSGQRVRKVRETVGYGGTTLTREEKIYLGDAEIKRIYLTTYDANGDPISTTKKLDRTSLHVMDDKSRVALVHHWTVDTNLLELDNTSQLNTHHQRYQFGNHLGSASLELDAVGSIISYEEYLPYGGTSFVAGTSQIEVRLKEYRYSGKERDSSTGFYYYGARYYAPWVGRWMSTDPLGLKAGINDYAFVRGNPITRIDVDGRQEQLPATDQSGGPGWPSWQEARKHQGDYNVSPADKSIASTNDQSTLDAAGVDKSHLQYLAEGVPEATNSIRSLADAAAELNPAVSANVLVTGETPSGREASTLERLLCAIPVVGTVTKGAVKLLSPALKAGITKGVARLRKVFGKNSVKIGGSAKLQPYGGPGGGHHVPAKSAFKGAPGYNANEALAIPNAEMAKLKVEHTMVTSAQASKYRAFAKTGGTLGWDDVTKIETEALIHGGMDAKTAKSTVTQAIQSLKDAGVSGPTRIPWGGR